MSRETNVHSIRALERQIEVKRARNSLNIYVCTPPEILGRVFAWGLVQQAYHPQAYRPPHSRDFAGLQKGSYNFLLVCHHWFEVASCTPELWGFWGNTLQDGKKRHHRSTATPLDLVLDGGKSNPGVLFDKSLQDAVGNRVVQDTIRKVHLKSRDCGTLTSIVSSLTPKGEGCRNENVESIVLKNKGSTSVDVSNFFARSRLPRLSLLDLSGEIRISSWDHLASRTTHLTTLSLKIYTSPPSPALAASQLFSILARNPNLQELVLFGVALPNVSNGSTFKVPLHDLKILSLAGEFHQLFGLLHRLILPETLDRMDLTGSGSTAEDVSQTLVPYMRDYFQRDTRFQDMLEVTIHSIPGSISISVTVEWDGTREQDTPYVALNVCAAAETFPPGVRERLLVDLFVPIPGEHVSHFRADTDLKLPEELFFMMPNIMMFHLADVELSEGFLMPNPDGPYADMILLPALEHLSLRDVLPIDDDWSPLTTFLANQTSDGRNVSLEIIGDISHMGPEVVKEINNLVKDFVYEGGPSTEEDDLFYL